MLQKEITFLCQAVPLNIFILLLKFINQWIRNQNTFIHKTKSQYWVRFPDTWCAKTQVPDISEPRITVACRALAFLPSSCWAPVLQWGPDLHQAWVAREMSPATQALYVCGWKERRLKKKNQKWKISFVLFRESKFLFSFCFVFNWVSFYRYNRKLIRTITVS